jgi:hypothetical protein
MGRAPRAVQERARIELQATAKGLAPDARGLAPDVVGSLPRVIALLRYVDEATTMRVTPPR